MSHPAGTSRGRVLAPEPEEQRAPSAGHDVDALLERLRRLQGIEDEYRVTMQVLAVVTERLLRATGGEAVVIDAEALVNSPDVEARREGSRVVITASR